MIALIKQHIIQLYLLMKRLIPIGSPIIYSGIRIAYKKNYLDRYFPSLKHQLTDKPRYEFALINALKRHVKADTKVLIVGGGAGITAIYAAQRAPNGSVVCYEGNKISCANINRAAKYANVNNLNVINKIVQNDIGVYGSRKSKLQIDADSLPDCDLLELDCEGAEIQILKNLTKLPRIIIVETHGFLGSTTQKVRQLLIERGYTVVDLGVAEPDEKQFCESNDIRVLEGILPT